MWFVYILECEDKSFYTGIALDVQKRFEKHVSKKGGKYTASHKPIRIAYTEECLTRSAALKREFEIKGWTREEKIEKLNLMPG